MSNLDLFKQLVEKLGAPEATRAALRVHKRFEQRLQASAKKWTNRKICEVRLLPNASEDGISVFDIARLYGLPPDVVHEIESDFPLQGRVTAVIKRYDPELASLMEARHPVKIGVCLIMRAARRILLEQAAEPVLSLPGDMVDEMIGSLQRKEQSKRGGMESARARKRAAEDRNQRIFACYQTLVSQGKRRDAVGIIAPRFGLTARQVRTIIARGKKRGS